MALLHSLWLAHLMALILSLVACQPPETKKATVEPHPMNVETLLATCYEKTVNGEMFSCWNLPGMPGRGICDEIRRGMVAGESASLNISKCLIAFNFSSTQRELLCKSLPSIGDNPTIVNSAIQTCRRTNIPEIQCLGMMEDLDFDCFGRQGVIMGWPRVTLRKSVPQK